MNEEKNLSSCENQPYYLRCTCCGCGIVNTPEDNTVYGKYPAPYDTGYGLCVRCGGDSTIEVKTDEDARTALGWRMTHFFDIRIKLLRDALNDKNKAKLDTMPYLAQCHMVEEMIKDGILKW